LSILRRFCKRIQEIWVNDSQRKLTGFLQLAGGFGFGVGYFISVYLLLLSAVGLSLLMLIGFDVRLKIKHKLCQSLPSPISALVNA